MQRAGASESNRQAANGRGAEGSEPRPTPLTLVSGALAGDDLRRIAATAAEALGRPVVVAIPALGEPIVSPPGSLAADQLSAVSSFAAAVAGGEAAQAPGAIVESVAIRIGERMVGIAAAGSETWAEVAFAERRVWLEATAAAASVTSLIRGTPDPPTEDGHAILLAELLAGPAEDPPGFLARARRLGVELSAGAVAICAQRPAGANGRVARAVAAEHGALLAEAPGGRVLCLSPAADGHEAAAVAGHLRELGMTVAVSAVRRDPATLHEAVREAELLLELARTPEVHRGGQDETYRLLIGVLLRDPEELAQLRATTISPLAAYDERHDADLVDTLRTFLAHDGSTTETAEAMCLHRHTVGYRLSRVHEVSGLSPYESDGRERLSLGLKAHQIIVAAGRRGLAGR